MLIENIEYLMAASLCVFCEQWIVESCLGSKMFQNVCI